MNLLKSIVGRMIYFVFWPALWVYLNNSKRARVMIISDNRVVVTKGLISGNSKWSLPGGGIKKGELPEVCAAREVEEELGIEIEPKDLSLVSRETTRKRGIVCDQMYYLWQTPEAVELKPHSTEIKSAEWVKIDSLNPNNSNDDVLLFLKRWKQTDHFATIK